VIRSEEDPPVFRGQFALPDPTSPSQTNNTRPPPPRIGSEPLGSPCRLPENVPALSRPRQAKMAKDISALASYYIKKLCDTLITWDISREQIAWRACGHAQVAKSSPSSPQEGESFRGTVL
jgi:hypothetical protein